MVGRIVMTPREAFKNQPPGFTKLMVGGILFSKDCPFSETMDWDMLDCEVTVTFTKHRKPSDDNKGDLFEIMCSMSEDKSWKRPAYDKK